MPGNHVPVNVGAVQIGACFSVLRDGTPVAKWRGFRSLRFGARIEPRLVVVIRYVVGLGFHFLRHFLGSLAGSRPAVVRG
eukprot:10306086-Heterocapsa_arctica.AAC.1